MTDFVCTQDGCQVASTGKCLEGFDPISTCPYIATSLPASPATDVSGDSGVFLDLPSGEALTEAQANDTARAEHTSLVVLVGPVDSGKTTILTSLYEAFQEAPFANFRFAGSSTLVGFERRCHDARVASGRRVPFTLRTPITESAECLHLRLDPSDASLFGAQSLLLSDISGEKFRALRDSTAAVSEMTLLQRADHFAIVVDGAKLVDPAQRQIARTDTRMLLRSVIEAGVLPRSCRIECVLSKWDLVTGASNRDEVNGFIAETKKLLTDQTGSLLPLSFFEVAARPESKTVPFAHGLPTLVRAWLEEPTVPLKRHLYMRSGAEGRREMSRFGRFAPEVERVGQVYDIQWV